MINPSNLNTGLVDSFTVTISAEKLKQMVKTHVLRELGLEDKLDAEVRFSVSVDRDMRGEPMGSSLKDVKVVCKPKDSRHGCPY